MARVGRAGGGGNGDKEHFFIFDYFLFPTVLHSFPHLKGKKERQEKCGRKETGLANSQGGGSEERQGLGRRWETKRDRGSSYLLFP